MAVSELNEDTQDQICDLLENLQQFVFDSLFIIKMRLLFFYEK